MEEGFVGHHGSPQRRFHFQYRSSLSYSVLSPSKPWFYSVVAVKKKRINMFTIRQDKVSCRLWWLLQKLCGQQLRSRTWCLLDLNVVPDIWWYKYICCSSILTSGLFFSKPAQFFWTSLIFVNQFLINCLKKGLFFLGCGWKIGAWLFKGGSEKELDTRWKRRGKKDGTFPAIYHLHISS